MSRTYAARIRFHDWMWKGGAKPKNPLRRLARRLPLYFSDPHALTAEEFDRLIFGLDGPRPPITMTTAPTPMWRVDYPQTYGSATSSANTLYFDWSFNAWRHEEAGE